MKTPPASRILKAAALCAAFLLACFAVSAQPVIATGDDFGAVVDEDGNLFVWGAAPGGDGGLGGLTQILPAGVWADVAASRTPGSEAHILAIRTDGSLWAWGNNARGQLGNGTQTSSEDPVKIGSGSWIDIAAGEEFSLAINSAGFLFAWGDNSRGQLGFGPIQSDPDLDIRKSPQFPLDSEEYISVGAGLSHAHAIRSDGTLWAWGSGANTLGFWADGIRGKRPLTPVLPRQIGSSTAWTQLFDGDDAVFALRGGELWVWGAGINLGIGGSTSSQLPVRVGSIDDWTSASASGSHTLALRSDGRLYGWGSNGSGELGLPHDDGAGNLIRQNIGVFHSPIQLQSPAQFTAVGAGGNFSAALRSDGFLLTSGVNGSGQLANGQTADDFRDGFLNSALGVADLAANGLTLTTDLPEAGATVSASLSIRNAGTGEITTDFELAAVLSLSPEFGDSDNQIPLTFAGGNPTLAVTQDFAAGEAATVPLSLEIPASVPQGDYFLVVRIDSEDAVEETDESNNDAATDAVFEFAPDLIFDPGDGIDIDPLAPSYDPGDPITATINLENTGEGALLAGTSFDIRVFLSPTQESDNSAAIDLDPEFTHTLAADLNPGDTLAIPFELPLPSGLATGNYFIGGVVDVNDDVAEQSELLSDANSVIREDGEANNEFFSVLAEVAILGIPLDEAMDQPGRVFGLDGAASWFGQDQVFTTDGDAAQSPSLQEGEEAVFGTSFTDPVVITFDWRADTTGPDNRLRYRVVGGLAGPGTNTISGDTGWISVQRVVPAGARVEWVYEQGADSTGDAAYVDNLQSFIITEPDLVVDDIDLTSSETGGIIESGSYVLLRDTLNLNVKTRNQGTPTGNLDEFAVSIYLSKDKNLNRPDGDPNTTDDILIRQFVEDEPFGGNPAVNGLSINLPPDVDPGEYYLIAYIDDWIDPQGNPLPGASIGTGEVAEFTGGGFPGESNNIFVTADPVVEIVALPDLVVSEVNAEAGYYFVEDDNGEPNSIDFDFTIENQGLEAVNDPIRVQVFFSSDADIDPESDFLVLDYEYDGGLSAAGVEGSTQRIDPDAVDIRPQVPIGEFLYFAVFIDALEEIDELDETNNATRYITSTLDRDFVFSEVSLAEALDVGDSEDGLFVNDEDAPFNGDAPWVGQTEESVQDGDAAMSVNIGDDQTAAFETTISPSSDTFVTFRWKVSSQNDEFGRDALNFYIDDMENPVATIFGTEGDWVRVSRFVEAGDHTLRWAYEKDELFSAGEDRGWVDAFSFQVPNLVVDSVVVDDSIGYQAGDTIDNWSVTVRNAGVADVPPTPALRVQVRVSGDNTWGGDGEFVLLDISDNQGLPAGSSRTYDETTHGPLAIPGEISIDSAYYVGAYVDWLPDNPEEGAIPESSETDNSAFTLSDTLQIAPLVPLPDAVDYADTDLEIGGPGGWYGVDDLQIEGGASDGDDAARSGSTGAGQRSYLETIVTGPAILDFQWKVLSAPNVNFLEFAINGVVQERISGDVDWEPKQFFIPSGTQLIRWTYRKTAGAGGTEDAGFLDQITITPFADAELALTNLTYTPGEYVLDVAGIAGAPEQLVGTEYLDVTVEAENQGATLPEDTNFSTADVEVRLSTDRVFGNGDDVVIGTFNQVEGDFESGNLMRFLGPIQLGDSIPAGSYYLMARVDSNDRVDEFDEANNTFISENRDVVIRRLPALEIFNPDTALIDETISGDEEAIFLDPREGGAVAFDIDEDLIYYPDSPMRLRFSIQNSGLGDVPGSAVWPVEFILRGAPRSELQTAVSDGDVEGFLGAFTTSVSLRRFDIQEFLRGRSEANPTGDIVDIDVELALPGGARLVDLIAEDQTIEDYLWLIEVNIDPDNVVQEAEIVQEEPALIVPTDFVWRILNVAEGFLSDLTAPNTDADDGLFGISFEPTTFDAGDWELLNPGYSTADPENLLAYAFNRNPADGDTAGGRFPGTYGVVEVGGEEFLSITFDIVTRATDIDYVVRAADTLGGLGAATPLVTIDGPFNELVGSASLTGDGGLIDEPQVLSVVDQGYSARVTIIDSQETGLSPTRFMRVEVDGTPAGEVD